MENTILEDKTLVCKSCQAEFKWSAKEQAYYQKRGLKKQPQKCSDCRQKANKLRDSAMFYIHCGFCDSDGAMLAPPPKDQVAICDECFQKLVRSTKTPTSVSESA